MSQNGEDVDGVVIEGESGGTEDSIDVSVQNQYRVWKKNAPFLYDFLSTNSLLWPSLSLQFFPDVVSATENDEHIKLQRLVLGTFTLGQAVDNISIYQLPTYANLNKNIKINKLDYNQEKQEFELSSASNTKIKLLQKINHFGDVNKVRYMPQKPNILASANNYGDLVIYERTKLPSVSRSNETELPKPQIYLRPQSPTNNSDIFALDWNLQSEAILASGDTNGHINIYDLKKYSSKCNELNEVKHIVNDLAINDLEWFAGHDSLFTVVDEGGHYKIYDTRSDTFVTERKLSECGINSITLNPGLSTCFATGDSTGVVSVWDIRNLDKCSYEIKNQHTDSITQLKWHRKFHNVLGSSSTDALVRLFDMNKHNETNDGTIFVHRGHMLGVNDFDWSYHDDWLVASVADDNSLQVWKPAHNVTGGYK